MIELFPNVRDSTKQLAKNWVDLALIQDNKLTGAKMVFDFKNTCNNEEEKDFVDFYFKLRMEQLLNESNID